MSENSKSWLFFVYLLMICGVLGWKCHQIFRPCDGPVTVDPAREIQLQKKADSLQKEILVKSDILLSLKITIQSVDNYASQIEKEYKTKKNEITALQKIISAHHTALMSLSGISPTDTTVPYHQPELFLHNR